MAFNLRALFGSKPETDSARNLYALTILAARDPVFFTGWGVPDTVEGRFEVLSLRSFLLLRRLKEEGSAADLAQAYFDVMFDDLDDNLRELGVGDMSIGKKVKKLAGSFYGRVRDYDAALAAPDDAKLRDTLGHFLFRGTEPSDATLAAACAFVRAESRNLASQPVAALATGDVTFHEVQA